MADDCVFCNGAPGNERLAESDRFIAIVDGFAVSPGHALVVPREHVESLVDLTPDEFAEAFRLLDKVRVLIDAAYEPDAYNYGINDGVAAGRTVHHLHIHLIPRFKGDVADPRGGVRNILDGPSPDSWSSRPDPPLTFARYRYVNGKISVKGSYESVMGALDRYGGRVDRSTVTASWDGTELLGTWEQVAAEGGTTPASAGAPEAPPKDLQQEAGDPQLSMEDR